LHSLITDGFLNHQVHLHGNVQELLWKGQADAV